MNTKFCQVGEVHILDTKAVKQSEFIPKMYSFWHCISTMIRRGLRVNEAALRLRPHAVKDTKMMVINIKKRRKERGQSKEDLCCKVKEAELKRRRDKA
jgi:hypothetical protein